MGAGHHAAHRAGISSTLGLLGIAQVIFQGVEDGQIAAVKRHGEGAGAIGITRSAIGFLGAATPGDPGIRQGRAIDHEKRGTDPEIAERRFFEGYAAAGTPALGEFIILGEAVAIDARPSFPGTAEVRGEFSAIDGDGTILVIGGQGLDVKPVLFEGLVLAAIRRPDLFEGHAHDEGNRFGRLIGHHRLDLGR